MCLISISVNRSDTGCHNCTNRKNRIVTQTVILTMMWDEGPGEDFQTHGHYINMTSEDYTRAACGFYTTSSGGVWAVQDFR